MSKDIKDYIHYYIGQSCTYDDPYYNNYGLDGVVTEKIIMFVRAPHLSGAVRNVKIHLRRLEDMTEEEAGEIFQLERNRNPEKGGHDFDLWKEKYGLRITRFDLTEQHLMLGFRGELYWVVDVPNLHIQAANNYPLIFHSLLSNGFDLFGLIPAGLAIDSATLTKK